MKAVIPLLLTSLIGAVAASAIDRREDYPKSGGDDYDKDDDYDTSDDYDKGDDYEKDDDYDKDHWKPKTRDPHFFQLKVNDKCYWGGKGYDSYGDSYGDNYDDKYNKYDKKYDYNDKDKYGYNDKDKYNYNDKEKYNYNEKEKYEPYKEPYKPDEQKKEYTYTPAKTIPKRQAYTENKEYYPENKYYDNKKYDYDGKYDYNDKKYDYNDKKYDYNDKKYDYNDKKYDYDNKYYDDKKYDYDDYDSDYDHYGCKFDGYAIRLEKGIAIATPYNKWWDPPLATFFVDDDTQLYTVSKDPFQLYIDSVTGALKYTKVGWLPPHAIATGFFHTGTNPLGLVSPSPSFLTWPSTAGIAFYGAWLLCPLGYTGQYQVFINNKNFDAQGIVPEECEPRELAAINANPWKKHHGWGGHGHGGWGKHGHDDYDSDDKW